MSTLSRTIAVLRRVVHELDDGCLPPRDAVDILSLFAEGERLCAAGKTLVAKRIDDTGIWKHEGHQSAANLVATVSGTSIGHAQQVVDTARRLSGLSRTEDALRSGQLSHQQAHEVTTAAEQSPDAERALLECAQSDGLTGLQQLGARVKDAALSEEDREARHARIHRRRSLRFWTDADGAERGAWTATPEAGARLRAVIRAEQERVFRRARKAKQRESVDAYAFDALYNVVTHRCGEGDAKPAPSTTVLMRVDASRLQRAATDDDGICEIAGVGPVPVSVALEELGNDAMVKLVITKGVDVLNVTHIGRTRTAAVQTALDWMYDECSVVGCHRRVKVEYHHTRPFRYTGHTRLDEIAPLCSFHHRLVEQGYVLVKRCDGEFDLMPPDSPHDDRGPP